MDAATSRRVTLLRFPLILLVLYIHSFISPLSYQGTTVALAPAPWLLALQTAWSNGFARTAVPLFFLLSGYLYFIGFDGSFAAYRTKTARRVTTLLVPYLFWNLLVFTAVALGQMLPATAGLFNAGNGRIVDASPARAIDIALGVTQYPPAYPFWFIRDLMLIVLATPAIHWLVKRLGVAVPLVLLLWWATKLPSLPMPSIEGITFFVAGAWVAMRGRALFPPAGWLKLLAPLYLAVLALDVTQRMLFPDIRWFYTSAVAIGVVLVLALVSLIERNTRISATLVIAASASFFVFAAHEPLMTLLRKLLYRIVPPSQAVIFAGYALLPLLLAAALASLYFVLARLAPRFTALISGGR